MFTLVTPSSFDATQPDRPDELERVEAAGGRVINWNGYRILGVLATSRSIGTVLYHLALYSFLVGKDAQYSYS
jgi:hypothetical protein